MKLFKITPWLILFPFLIMAQTKYTGKKLELVELLESKRKEFQNATNDSLYLAKNSDKIYTMDTYITRGEQADDIEAQIFSTPLKGVAGPFDGDESFYLLKIIGMDSLYRTQAKLISLFPKGEMVNDTVKFSALVNGYIEQIGKGKPITKMLVKDEAFIGIKNKGVLSFWENRTSQKYFNEIFNKNLNETIVTKEGKEYLVLYVIEQKTKAPYKAKVLKLIKRVKE